MKYAKENICYDFRLFKMANNDLTYWKNYQTAMQWIKEDGMNHAPAMVMRQEEENEVMNNEDEELEFTIDDDLLDFYRLSRVHKANRSKSNVMIYGHLSEDKTLI